MKKFLKILCVMALAFALAGCGADKSDDPLCGDWAYNHDPETVVLSLQPSGKATYNGESCKWERCDIGITLKAGDGSATDHRCVEDRDQILFYAPAVYTCADGADGIVGVWKNDKGWSYEFTDKGTFLEDGVLPGHYFVDEAAGTIKLAYNDPLEDTLLYYTLSDGELHVDYPWTMVRVE